MVENCCSKFVVVIPARAGSKGIPGKNTKPFHGKSLVEWAILTCANINEVHEIVVTTDSPSILELCKNFPRVRCHKRDESLSGDQTPIEPVILDAIGGESALRKDDVHCVLLFPTSPLRQQHHIEDCIDDFRKTNADCVFTVSDVPAHFHPNWQVIKNSSGQIEYFSGLKLSEGIARRDLLVPKTYAKNDLVFVFRGSNLILHNSIFGSTNCTLITDEVYSVDINYQHEWELAEKRFIEINASRN